MTTLYRIVTLSGRGLPTEVDANGYETKLAAEAMADAEHDGSFRIEAYEEEAHAPRPVEDRVHDPEI